ncbi:outer envelope pore protein 16-3, chloroplastic/mitochondrial [Panicum miliaceum]|uniref:Outer envelope pore protein 16-3, chloroplastic/mitochondrial n=1 Tax=Panicum miliaceum TaxID=4540 RepID=A0A3L6T6C6_PANMI|nr:outer envelope pore protein 16-3, chloroplastic/mitochondrial [Panicum miliaceum]
MENSNSRGSVDEEIVMKTGKAAGIGLAAGSWKYVKYPQLIRTGKVCGHYAASFAVIGATYVGVEQALEKYRMKKDIFNGVAAGFATGAVMGFRVGSPQTAFLSGSAIALTSVLLDVTGMRTTDEEEKGHH